MHLACLKERIDKIDNSTIVLVYRFNKVRFSIQAVHTAASRSSSSVEAVQQVEERLLQKKSEMRQFESKYRQVSSTLCMASLTMSRVPLTKDS